MFNKARIITRLGNTAVHSHRQITQFDAQTAVRELFHVGYWLAHTYAKGAKPAAGLAFDPKALPTTAPAPKQTIDQLQKLEKQLQEKDEKLNPRRRSGSTCSCSGCNWRCCTSSRRSSDSATR